MTVTIEKLLHALGISLGEDELDGRWGVSGKAEVPPDVLERAAATELPGDDPWEDDE